MWLTIVSQSFSVDNHVRDWGKLVKAVKRYEQFREEYNATGLNEELRDQSIDLWEGSQADIREIV